MLWAVRIGGFLLYRVLKTGSDNRFDDIRSKFLSFLGFWVGQILWVSERHQVITNLKEITGLGRIPSPHSAQLSIRHRGPSPCIWYTS